MIRKTPLPQRKAPIKRKQPYITRKSNDAYRKVRKAFFEEEAHQVCVGNTPWHSSYFACDIHHDEGRGAQTTNTDSFIPLCRGCHEFVHAHPAYARKHGLMK